MKPKTLPLESVGALPRTPQGNTVPLTPNCVAARKLAHSVQKAQSAFGGKWYTVGADIIRTRLTESSV